MTDTSSNNDLRFTPAGNKRTAPNVSSGWVVMVLSGLIAVVIFLYITAQGGQKFQVLIATKNIAPGDIVNSSSFTTAEVNVDQAQLSRLIAQKDEATYNGYVATGPMSQGDLVTKSELQPAAASNGNLAMSITTDKTHAVDGDLKVGDTIDLIDETTGAIAVTDLSVTNIDSSSGSALGGAGNYTVTVSASADQVPTIATVLKNGKFDIVNATGAGTIGTAQSGSTTASTTSTTSAP